MASVAVTTGGGVEKSGVVTQGIRKTDGIVPGVQLSEGIRNLVGVKDGADATIKKASVAQKINKTQYHMSP